MRGINSRTGRVVAPSRHPPIRPAGKCRPLLPWMRRRTRKVAAPAVAGRAAVCLATAAAIALMGASAAPATASGQGWSVTPSPNPQQNGSAPTAYRCDPFRSLLTLASAVRDRHGHYSPLEAAELSPPAASPDG